MLLPIIVFFLKILFSGSFLDVFACFHVFMHVFLHVFISLFFVFFKLIPIIFFLNLIMMNVTIELREFTIFMNYVASCLLLVTSLISLILWIMLSREFFLLTCFTWFITFDIICSISITHYTQNGSKPYPFKYLKAASHKFYFV